jgi:hypothetical protein
LALTDLRDFGAISRGAFWRVVYLLVHATIILLIHNATQQYLFHLRFSGLRFCGLRFSGLRFSGLRFSGLFLFRLTNT